MTNRPFPQEVLLDLAAAEEMFNEAHACIEEFGFENAIKRTAFVELMARADAKIVGARAAIVAARGTVKTAASVLPFEPRKRSRS